MKTALSSIVWLLLFASLSGCSTGSRAAAPSGASAGITEAAAPTGTISGVTMHCEGPADQLAMLGTLCSAERLSGYVSPAQNHAVALTIGSGTGPALLVYGFAPAGTPDDAPTWSTTGIGYASYLLLSRPIDVPATDEWSTGESLTGSLGTVQYLYEACRSDAWVGGGVLHWHDVTLTLTWSAAIPC